eukprot:TRINITY_DN8271_c0_g1_i2.p1 TRINITY_DN8271_c0_g1~~TRINITY_DN8271_c0_g1_i2.p1  ORF type:complete len:259 (-),score=24.58 TRINITY_DN8271_c0_g1_i2:494-1270(-)
MSESAEGDSSENGGEDLSIEVPVASESRPKHTDHIFWLKGVDLSELCITSFIHPKTDQYVRYVFNHLTKEVLEIQKTPKEPASYFLDECVKEDGRLYLTTPIDKYFLFIPRLEQCRQLKGSVNTTDKGIFVCKDQIYEECSRKHNLGLLRDSGIRFDIICDRKEVDGKSYYRLNDNKVLHWLRHKVDVIGRGLESSKLDVASLTTSQTYGFRSLPYPPLTNNQKIKIAIGILSEYILPSRAVQLKQSYGRSVPAVTPT